MMLSRSLSVFGKNGFRRNCMLCPTSDPAGVLPDITNTLTPAAP